MNEQVIEAAAKAMKGWLFSASPHDARVAAEAAIKAADAARADEVLRLVLDYGSAMKEYGAWRNHKQTVNNLAYTDDARRRANAALANLLALFGIEEGA